MADNRGVLSRCLLSTYRSEDRVIIQCESVAQAEEALSRLMAWLLGLDKLAAPRMLRDGWFRLGPDGQWHPVQPFMLAGDEDEARTVQMCFPGQSVEFRGGGDG